MVAPEPSRPAAEPRYREICHLATGGMAEVHLAKMTGLGGFERLVVIKRLKAALASAPDWVQGLLDEARIAARLQHGNIVGVHDVTLEAGTVSIVMEYLHGQNVRALLRRALAQLPGGVVPLEPAVAIVLGVCAGLHHAHDQVDATGTPLGVVHRDVSADNVIVTYDGGVKLIDFGIARAHSRLGQTEVGIAKGKPGYMAPEQITCEPIDRRADVHAAAVLLYEITVGRLPRDGASDYEMFNATVESDPIPPRVFVRDYPEELAAILMRGMARAPAARFQTALEMQHALEAFARRGKLDMSSFALARLMEKVFGDKLEAWRAAQKAGRSLAEHVAAVQQSTMAHGAALPAALDPVSVARPVPTSASHPAPGSRRRPVVAYALLGVVAAAAIGLGAWRAGLDQPRDPAPVPTKPDVPETVTAPAPPTPNDTAAAPPVAAPAVADDPEHDEPEQADEPEEIVLPPEVVAPVAAADPSANAERDRPIRRRAVEKARDKRRRKQPADAQPATATPAPKPKPTPEPERVDPDDPLPR